jgi:hypothetical protein
MTNIDARVLVKAYERLQMRHDALIVELGGPQGEYGTDQKAIMLNELVKAMLYIAALLPDA